jgi:adenine phosphoribosyltransferase
MTKDIRDYIRTIPDFPHKGILFRDVTTLFGSADGLNLSIIQIVDAVRGMKIDKVAGLEARGFILGGAVAQQLGVGFVPIRKKGKLPGKTIEQDYTLEYGTATMELHDDAIEAGENVLLVDDLIATGGTAEAGIKLIEALGGAVVQSSFIIDLPDLGGADKIKALGVPVQVLCAFDGL